MASLYDHINSVGQQLTLNEKWVKLDKFLS